MINVDYAESLIKANQGQPASGYAGQLPGTEVPMTTNGPAQIGSPTGGPSEVKGPDFSAVMAELVSQGIDPQSASPEQIQAIVQNMTAGMNPNEVAGIQDPNEVKGMQNPNEVAGMQNPNEVAGMNPNEVAAGPRPGGLLNYDPASNQELRPR